MIFVYLRGRPFWLRRMNSAETFEMLLGWLRGALDGGDPALPPPLAPRAFAWTGGGEGPAPPIEDGV